jgi:hypothetical protein
MRAGGGPSSSRARSALLYAVAPAAIILIGLLPLLLAIASSLIADMAGCQLDEGGSHACRIMGREVGDLLQFFFVMGWLGLITIPAAGMALLVWAATLLIRFMVRRKA